MKLRLNSYCLELPLNFSKLKIRMLCATIKHLNWHKFILRQKVDKLL